MVRYITGGIWDARAISQADTAARPTALPRPAEPARTASSTRRRRTPSRRTARQRSLTGHLRPGEAPGCPAARRSGRPQRGPAAARCAPSGTPCGRRRRRDGAQRAAAGPRCGRPERRAAGHPGASPGRRWPVSDLWRAVRLLGVRRRRVLLAVLAGSAGLGSAVGLAAVSAWLIARASQMPPVMYLTIAAVTVRT